MNASVTDLDEILLPIPLVAEKEDDNNNNALAVPINGMDIKYLSGEALDSLLQTFGLHVRDSMLDVEKRIAWCRFIGCGMVFISKVIES